MNLAPPIRRLGRPAPGALQKGSNGSGDRTASKTTSRTRTGGSVVQRERHQADYVILVVVVALTAIGILMVYSSSAIRGYLSSDADTFATVGPQIQWADPRDRRDGRDDARRLPLPPSRIGAVLRGRAGPAGGRPPAADGTPAPDLGRRVRALAADRAAAGHPSGRGGEARAGHLPRALVRQAGDPGREPVGRHRRLPGHRHAGHRAGLQGARPRDDDGHHVDRLHDVLPGGREHRPPQRPGRRRVPRDDPRRPAGLPDGPDPGLAGPVVGQARGGVPHHPGAARARGRRRCSAAASARARCRCPTPSTTSSSPRSDRSSA